MTKNIFLLIHCGYTETSVALYHADTCRLSRTLTNKEASAHLLPVIENFLQQEGVTLADCAFIAAHAGPAPFTSLRVALATVNGLGCGALIPLIGLNGLELFVQEYQYTTDATVALLNAFGNDVYVGIKNNHTGEVQVGCMPFSEFLHYAALKNISFTCIGYGAQLYEKQLRDSFGDFITIPSNVPRIVSVDALAREARRIFEAQGASSHPIVPVYLKAYSARMGKTYESA